MLIPVQKIEPGSAGNYKDPSPEQLTSKVFEVIWQEIKSWDINCPKEYTGYCGATGNHVAAILNALEKAGINLQSTETL